MNGDDMDKTKVYIAGTGILDNDELYEKLYDKVSSKMKEKTDRYRLRKDKNLSVGAGTLLRFALANEGIYNFETEYRENGKPYIKGTNGLYFNVSHSHEVVMCAVSGCEVGCDVEKIRKCEPSMAKRFFSDSEYRQIMKCETEKDRADAFCRIWTLKESFIKATGFGMKLKLDSFSIDISDEIPKVFHAVNSKEYFFREFNFDDDYRYAVCSESPCFGDACFVELDNV